MRWLAYSGIITYDISSLDTQLNVPKLCQLSKEPSFSIKVHSHFPVLISVSVV